MESVATVFTGDTISQSRDNAAGDRKLKEQKDEKGSGRGREM